jgi:hypothetical protein
MTCDRITASTLSTETMNAIDVIAAVAIMNMCVAGSCCIGRSFTPLGVHGNPSIE